MMAALLQSDDQGENQHKKKLDKSFGNVVLNRHFIQIKQ
jgi:hypothetical protein